MRIVVLLPLLVPGQWRVASLESSRRQVLVRAPHVAAAAAAAGVLPPPLVSQAYCDDTCIFESTRRFERAGRTLVIRQEFKEKSGTGMGVWECAEVLSAYLAEHPQRGRVLELGCGCALCSMVAALGGADVTASDGDAGVLDLARRNLDANGFREIEVAQRRWEQARAGDNFDVVIGADLTYVPDAALPLANALLASGASTAFIAHKRRQARDDATLATLETYFGPVSIVGTFDHAVSLLRLDRRPNAPPDLADLLSGVQCNPGYRPRNGLCIPDSSSST